jgi:hypothetical protein
MNKMLKVLILVMLTLLLTTTVVNGRTVREAREIQTLLLKGSATLHKSYASLFLLVNEIKQGATGSGVDFLTAQSTVETIKYTLLDSRDFFSRAKDIHGPDLCHRKIGEITELLDEMDRLAKDLKAETVPSGETFRALNEKYLECLRLDPLAEAHALKQ